jgi:anthranilate synthase component II
VNRILLVDHFDSFSQLLACQLEEGGRTVLVTRSSTALNRLVEEAEARDAVVLSPGPGSPTDVPDSVELCRRLEGRVPVLGICLGHQCLAAAGGVPVVRAPAPRHGKAEVLAHDGQGPFAGLPGGLRVGRYHSLGIRTAPDGYQVHARADGLVMAMESVEKKAIGWQFHPESILTPLGADLLTRAFRTLGGAR